MSTSGKTTLLMVFWLLWIAAVIVGELLPASSAPMVFLATTGISDKLLHFGSYLGMVLLPALMFGARRAALAGILAIALGIGLEFGQRLVPGRSYDLADMLANTAGVLTGLLLGLALRAFSPEH